MILNGSAFGHDNLRGFVLGRVGKLTEVVLIGENVGGADTGDGTASVDADGVKTKAEGVGQISPGAAIRFGAGIGGVAAGVGNGLTGRILKWVSLMGENLVTVTGGSRNGDSVGVGGAGEWSKSAKINGEVLVVDTEGEAVEGVVDVLEAGLDDKTAVFKLAGSILADSVGEAEVGRIFAAGSHVEVAKLDLVGVGAKSVCPGFYGKDQSSDANS